ncbi:MAG TPA: LpqB family beta-propeller domain-containing protein [Anaerolineales bacterium]|nr:LpqB family beta-propeller domain-containing protein [Anaerolineales bacterium]
MNKEILKQTPADEQLVAFQLDALVEDLQLSPTFQWELETQLMEQYETKTQSSQPGWYTKIMPAVGWAILAIGAVFLLSSTMRSVIPDLQPAAAESPTPERSFEEDVRQGNRCAGLLTVAHNFSVALTDEYKTSFVMLDEYADLEEIRSFAWSPDGTQLAVVGNLAGQGKISVRDFGKSIQYVISSSEVGYLTGASWSRTGKQLLMWSSQNNSLLYVVNAGGNDLVERPLDAQIFGMPQFAPDGKSLLFYGADASGSDGLLQAMVDGSQIKMVSDLVDNENSFAFSPDGTRLAYIEMDRTLGEARLIAQELPSDNKTVLATLPIPKGSGSSIPESANLGWSPDGKSLAFDFGRGASDRAVYLADADGMGLVKLAESAHAPAISVDGGCLAYISDKQVFVLDLGAAPLTPTTPVFLADLPVGRGVASFKLDKLQWRP